jgi:hypothetical protein
MDTLAAADTGAGARAAEKTLAAADVGAGERASVETLAAADSGAGGRASVETLATGALDVLTDAGTGDPWPALLDVLTDAGTGTALAGAWGSELARAKDEAGAKETFSARGLSEGGADAVTASFAGTERGSALDVAGLDDGTYTEFPRDCVSCNELDTYAKENPRKNVARKSPGPTAGSSGGGAADTAGVTELTSGSAARATVLAPVLASFEGVLPDATASTIRWVGSPRPLSYSARSSALVRVSIASVIRVRRLSTCSGATSAYTAMESGAYNSINREYAARTSSAGAETGTSRSS